METVQRGERSGRQLALSLASLDFSLLPGETDWYLNGGDSSLAPVRLPAASPCPSVQHSHAADKRLKPVSPNALQHGRFGKKHSTYFSPIIKCSSRLNIDSLRDILSSFFLPPTRRLCFHPCPAVGWLV